MRGGKEIGREYMGVKDILAMCPALKSQYHIHLLSHRERARGLLRSIYRRIKHLIYISAGSVLLSVYFPLTS